MRAFLIAALLGLLLTGCQPRLVYFCGTSYSDSKVEEMAVEISRVSVSREQGTTVEGVVRTLLDGSPLPGVTLMVEGTRRGSTTDMDGRFVLGSLEADDLLRFSNVRYATRYVPVDSLQAPQSN